jgi:hypothetical protein
MTERAIEEGERILDEHEPPPLNEYQERHLDEIMDTAAIEMKVDTL